MTSVTLAVAHNDNLDGGLANASSESSEAHEVEPDDHHLQLSTRKGVHQLVDTLGDRQDHVAMANGLHARLAGAPLTRKKMNEEAIAGTVVGTILGVALVICCLYPLIIRQLKKHKRLDFDCEDGIRGGISVRRLSASDSYKHTSSPHEYDTHPYDSYRYTGVPQAPPAQYVNAVLDPNIPIDPVTNLPDYSLVPNLYPFNEGQIVQGPLAPHQYVLKGTNEDYYSPYIPSEAFGMFPEPEPVMAPSQPAVAAARGSSLRYNMKQIFRRKTIGEQSPSSQGQGDLICMDMAQVEGGVPMQRLYPQQPSNGAPSGAISRSLPPDSSKDQNDSQSYSSPPGQFTMGTVNPMDIMAPSTESEMWYRTDYQLFATPYDQQQAFAPYPVQFQSLPNDYMHMQMAPNFSIPQFPQQQPPPPAPPLSAPPEPPAQQGQPQEQRRTGSIASQSDSASRMGTTHLSHKVSNMVAHSELSSSAQGTASATTQSTPSTHVDSSSPASLNSSDYGRQSGSPHANSVPSPRAGAFPCDEPGCNQVFDQPHKLKHHQRYHSKDHKCPYPACGKGFGTKTHLQRHINDRHEKKKKFHCSIQGCDYSRAGGKAFPRKDNWKRHMTKIHGIDHHGLPEPIEVDSEVPGLKSES